MQFEERVKRRNQFDASYVYGTREFNLRTGRDKHMNHRKTSDTTWLNPATGLVHPHFVVHRPCPVCANDNYNLLFIKHGFSHVRCHQCELVYVPDHLNQEEYEKLYETEESWGAILESDEQKEMQVLEAEYSLDIASLYVEDKSSISVCDVGCGPGRLLACAKKRGYEVLGIEPNKRSHVTLKQAEIPYIDDFFPLKDTEIGPFNMVFTLNTLEHLTSPDQSIKDMAKLLKPGGILYISVPNINALVTRILHEKSGVFGGHAHLQFFNHKTLSKLLENNDFEILEYETIITELGVIMNHLGFEDSYLGRCKDNLGFLTPEMIYKNHLARNVNIVARRKK